MTSQRELIYVAGKDLLTEVGGHSAYVRAQALAATAAGYTPQIFCVGWESDIVDAPFGRVHRIRSPLAMLNPEGPGKGFRNPWFVLHAPLLRKRIEAFLAGRTGVAIVHGFFVWGGVALELRRRQKNRNLRIVPVVNAYTTLEHEYRAKLDAVSPDHGMVAKAKARIEYHWMTVWGAKLERRVLEDSDLVLVNYDSVENLIQALGVVPRRLRKVAYSSKMAFEDSADRPEAPLEIQGLKPAEAPLVVSVSRHDPRKGLDTLLRALARLRQRGVAFRACLVGPGPLIEPHRRLARDLDLGDSTAIVGFVPDPRVFLGAADVFVLPSIEEGSGSVSLLEALQSGLAIVASDLDGIPEDVTDGDSALLAPPGEVEALSRQLELAVTDGALRERLQHRAREVFEERFSAPIFTQAMEAVYSSLFDDHQGEVG